jgi:glycosyltransferase involved in cell wall biosynthesis/predicted O-methyltransferase YrrM
MTASMSSHNDAAEAYAKALQAYEACDVDPVAIGQWCIPELDAQMLVEHVVRDRPKRVLEVGTYVGVSTLLIAISADRDTSIVSIDPNFPLRVEMASMGSALGRLDGAMRTQDVARAAARQIGVDGRIRFVNGGFATGKTFASARTGLNTEVPIIGPSVCEAFGPFDLIFIDGLHYAWAVEADLRLAAKALAPGGTILMHDCIGMWGTNVRAGIYRFLDDNPEFRLLFPPFHSLYSSIGTVFRTHEHPELAAAFRADEPQGSDLSALTTSLAGSIVNRLRVRSVIELVRSQPVAERAFADLGVPVSVVTLSVEPDSNGSPPQQRVPEGTLVVSLGALDHLPDYRVEQLLRWLRNHQLVALLGFTPPGESGVAGRESRSLRQVLRLASDAGLKAAGLSRLDLDPVQFGFKDQTVESVATSFCNNLVLVGPSAPIHRLEQDQGAAVFPLHETQAENLEQEDLLRLHYVVAFRRLFADSRAMARSDADLRRQLGEQIARSEDLVGQIGELSAALVPLAAIRMLASPLREALAPMRRFFGALRRGPANLKSICRTLFIRHLDDVPKVVIASALTDAERRGVTPICVFLSYHAEPGMLRKLLTDPRVESVGSKDNPAQSLLPEDLAKDPRVGYYWEPGHWSLPERSTHIYFVGPWRLMTLAMLWTAVRHGVQSLRVRVAKSWAPMPLPAMRQAKAVARAMRVGLLVRAMKAGGSKIAGALRMILSLPQMIARHFHRAVKQAYRIRKTLFIRYLDDMPEVLITSALTDAEQRGVTPICVFLSYHAEPGTLRKLLTDPRVESVGNKDNPAQSLLPEDLAKDPRVGYYWEPGHWSLPERSTHIYFVGPWRLMTKEMLREAFRRGVASLRVRVAVSWVSVPLTAICDLHHRARPLVRAARYSLDKARALSWWARRIAFRTVTLLWPDAIDLASRLAGPAGLQGMYPKHVFGRALHAVKAQADTVPRRVVHVCGNLQPGGAERQLVYTLEGLCRQNLESVQLLCHNLTPGTKHRHDFYLPAVAATGAKVREIRRRTTTIDFSSMPAPLRHIARFVPVGLALDISDLYWEFTELRPEVVHAWLDWDNVRTGPAAVLAGVPKVILSCRNINPSHFELYQPYMDAVYRALAQAPNVTLINNSRAGAEDYADWIGIHPSRIGVINNALDFGTQARSSPEAAASLRHSFGIPADAFVVGGVFRLEEEKRPLFWLETAALVAREIDSAWFVIFGQGRMQDQVQRKAKQIGLGDRFILAGITYQVLQAMSMMDVLLLTSRGEGLPNVLLEAQWVGTPVVTTDVGGAKEAIEPGVTGWAVASDRASDVSRQITCLHRNPVVLAEARNYGPAFVRKQFGVARMISQTMKVYGYQ